MIFIDADKLISHLNDEIEACGDADINCRPIDYGTYLGLKYAKSLVETAETADVQEVRHAKFELIDNGKGVCSNCHRLDSIDNIAKYCRYCGAKMDWNENGVCEH